MCVRFTRPTVQEFYRSDHKLFQQSGIHFSSCASSLHCCLLQTRLVVSVLFYGKNYRSYHKNMNRLNEATSFALSSECQAFRFVPLDLPSLYVEVIVDASFATNCDSLSQIRFVVTLIDGSNNFNVLHYSSSKSRHIARSALDAELSR